MKHIRIYIHTQWRSCLMHCPTSQKVAGSNPLGVINLAFRPYYDTGFDSAAERTHFQGYFVEVKATGA